MSFRSIVAGLLLGSLLCTPGFGLDLIDRMLGLDGYGGQPVHVETCPHCQSQHVVGEGERIVGTYVAESEVVGRSFGPFQNVSSVQLTACQPPACQPSTCEPAACEPVCGPAGCGPCMVDCEGPRPMRDMFLKLRAMFACNVCCTSPCCCEPACYEPACCPPATCEPACGPVCGPMACDPCGPKPLMGLFQNVLARVKCSPAFCDPVCCEPACGCGQCGGMQHAPAEPDADATDPAPMPPEAPTTPPTARWQKPAENVRSTGFFDFHR
jgi:hypothetical protein